MMINCVQCPVWKNPTILASSSSTLFRCFQTRPWTCREANQLKCNGESIRRKRRGRRAVDCQGFLLPVDPWAPNVDSQSIASQLFAFSLFPYLGFLYFITKSKTAPKLTLFGFYFLLAFVGATIPAGIYAKVKYGTSLSNVDWLHGGAESLLTLTNLFIVLGLRAALRKSSDGIDRKSIGASEFKEKNPLP
ncbi:PREDICTED: uncharacterized protein LOC109147979 [Ipomoea nil]|uniref:uncharacterized protein LOC109147979 n=1 Tax=Ipomoea nil TaxID=35883 RepID=UPI000900C5A4|nr:PREDICTED: uncharacterized protein LOC109147979 [Ipomoea nil]